MTKKLLNIFDIINSGWNYLQRKGFAVEHQFIPLAAIGFFSFISYYFIWSTIDPQEYENIYLRIVGGLLCFALMLKNYWPLKFRPFMPLFWYITLIYCFPFFFHLYVI